MSGISDTATVTLNVNGAQAKKMMAEVEAKIKQTEASIASMQKAMADPKDIEKARKQLNNYKKQLSEMQSATEGVKRTFDNLDIATPRQLQRALTTLNKQLKDMPPGTAVWNSHCERIRTLNARLNELKGATKEQISLWKQFRDWSVSAWPALDLIKGWYDTIVQGMRQYVDAFASMDQEMANVRKFTGMSADQVSALNDEFKKIDTRSGREQLNMLAQEAGRLGKTSQEDVLGFVRAADKINVALDDLGEGATLTLSKLTNIFGDEQRYGTEQSLLKVGSVINELSQNCSASAPYLAHFAERMGGVGAQAGLSIPQIMGFGAVLDANAQALEASSTALSQVIVRMYQDPAKYARVAGLDVKNFSRLMREDANEALLLFLETLHNAGGMDTLSPMFKDMGENGSRAIASLSTLATHIDLVRSQQRAANVAFQEGTSIDKEFAVQNGTVQASLEKCKNAANELRVSLGQQLYPVMGHLLTTGAAVMRLVKMTVEFIVKNKSAIIPLVWAIAAYQAAVHYATIKTALFNAAMKAVTVAEAAMTAATHLCSAAMNLLRGNLMRAAVSFRAFSAALMANPIGLVVAAVAAAIAAITQWVSKTREAAAEARRRAAERKREVDEFNRSILSLGQLSSKYADKEISNLKKLYKAATDESLAKQKRIEAVRSLQKMYPAYFGNLTAEQIMVGEAAGKYDQLSESILKSARAHAAYDKIKENESKRLDLEMEKADALDERRRIDADSKRLASALSDQRGLLRRGLKNNVSELRDEYNQSRQDAGNALMRAAKADAQMKQIDAANARLQKFAAPPADTSGSDPDFSALSSSGSTPGYTSAKQAAKEAKAAAAEAKRQAVKERKEFNDELNAVNAAMLQAKNEALALRSIGEIDYLEYNRRLYEADVQYYDDALGVYEKHFADKKEYMLEDDKGYQKLQNKRLDRQAKHNEELTKLSLEQINRERTLRERDARERYDLSKKSYADELAMNEELFRAKIDALEKQLALYDKGSKEYANIEQQIEDAIHADAFDKQKKFQEKVAALKKKYAEKSATEQYKIEKEILDVLLEKKKISVAEYQKMLDKLTKDTLKLLPGTHQSKAAKAGADKEKSKKDLDDALAAGLISEQEYTQRMARVASDALHTVTDELRNSGDEWVAMFTDLGVSWVDLFTNFEGTAQEKLAKVAACVQGTAAVITGAMQVASQFAQANAQIELAAVEKRYDREKSLAEGNSYKLAQLEKKKEAEVAKIKRDANRKAFAMQVIQAIAQTATNALNAYGSAAAIPFVGHILAPIAAGVATASGLLQVALIKKQQQASEAQGYSKGGFTKPGAVDEPAGIVHAGEWVASQKLLSNPIARPMIDALDYAQRTNSIGSLRMEDVSRSITANNSLVRIAENDNGTLAMAAAMAQSSQAISALTKRLQEPFVTVNTVTGDLGIKKAQDEYNLLMKNKSPKSKK